MEKLLAAVFDFFKAKNPKIAGLILLILMTIVYFLDNGGLGLLGPKASEIAQYIVTIIIAITGSRTTALLSKK